MFSVYANGQLIYFPLEEDLVINSPKLNLEMGKAGSFQFGLPPTHRYYNLLQNLKTIITVEYDGVEIFRGRVLTMNRGFNNIRQVVCEGDLAYLVDSVQKGVKYKGGTHALFRQIIANHNSRVEDSKKFTVGNITVLDKDVIISGSSDTITKYETTKFDYEQIVLNSIVDDWMTTYDYIQDTIIEYCGGYLRTRRVGDTTYIDLLKDYGQTSIQKIEFGTNLIDLSEEVKSEDLYTVLIPLGEDNLTISKLKEVHEVREGPSGDLIYYTSGDEIIDVRGVAQYGRIVKTHTFDSVNNVETLVENGFDLLRNHENMPITFTIKAVDMHMVDGSNGAIYVGDKVYLNSIPHSLTQYLTCTKIEYDMNNPANNTYTFGNPKQTMTERYKKDKKKTKKSGRSSAGKAGKAADVASVEADTNLEQFAKEEGRRIDAWLNVDKDQGHISLGALYNDWHSAKDYMTNTVGIDLDAKTATISLSAIHEKVNATESLLNKAGITIDGVNAGITLTAEHQKTNKMGQLMNDAGITIDAVKAGMNLYANYKLTDNLGKIIQNNLGIKLDGSQGKLDIFADHTTTVNMKDVITNKLGLKMDASQGKIDLGVVSTKVGQMAQVITRDLGLKLDASNGQVTLMNKLHDLSESSAKFESFVSGTKVTAGMYAEMGGKVSSVETWIENNKSKIVLNADMVSFVDGSIIDAKKTLRADFSKIVTDYIKAGFSMTGRLNAVDINASGLVSVKDLSNSNKATLRNLAVTGKCTCEYKGVQSAIATEAWAKQYIKDQLKNYASSSHKHEVSFSHTHTVNPSTNRTNSQSITKVKSGTPVT